MTLEDRFSYNVQKGETFSIVSQDGTANDLDPGLHKDILLKIYRLIVQARSFDEKAMKLQRAGRMGTYPPLIGQEAVQIGSALALGDKDWMVPSYREQGSMMAIGVSMKLLYMVWMGNEYGNAMPKEIRCLPVAIPVGSQALHATGFAWAAKLKKEPASVLCYFGDGATSRGDFHEALNFAGVYQVPAVFLCSNNQFAISTRMAQQTHAETLAQKGLAYGIPSYRLDGMDVLASYVLTRELLENARNGQGPAFVEALCYRYGPHTTSDNPDLYRTPEEVEKAKRESDPVVRFRNYLRRKDLWGEDDEKHLVEEIDALVDKAAKDAEQAPVPPLDALFKNVFETMPQYLKEELEYYRRVSGGK